MAPDRPNVLFVLTDQWAAHAMGCAGNEQVRTPNLDRLAAGGTRFTRAYTPYPVCSPARGSILTGQYPHEHGVIRNTFLRLPLPTEANTLAEPFADAGYRTGYIGKWHLDGSIDGPGFVPPGPRRQGFQYWKGFDLGHEHLRGHPHYTEDGDLHWEEGLQPDIQTRLAIEFIEASDDPFFCFLSWGPPHTPLEAPEEYSDRYDADDLDRRPNVPEDMAEEVREDLVEYYGMITWLDTNLGRLLDALDERGIAEDTLVVFTADHGEMMGSHGHYHKGIPHEESVTVPLVVRHPSVIPADRETDAFANLIDLMPTLLSACGLPVPDSVQGQDLSPVLRGDGTLGREGVYLEGALPADNEWRAFRDDRGLIAVDRDLAVTHLFDMRADPYQQENLAGDDAADLREYLYDRLVDAAYEFDDRYFKARHAKRASRAERIDRPTPHRRED